MKHDFQYISKNNQAVKDDYNNLVKLLNELQKVMSKSFTFQYTIVGSYKRNMITYDTKSNVGYDFNFNIEVNDEVLKASQIKQRLLDGLNKVAPKYGYDFPENSTSVITIKKKDTKKSRIISSCDFCIVNNYEDEEGNDCQEYIHFDKKTNTYFWNERSAGYYLLPDKIEWVKDNNLWDEVRTRYIKLKNTNVDPDIHSRTLFANAVHQMCQKYGYFEEE